MSAIRDSRQRCTVSERALGVFVCRRSPFSIALRPQSWMIAAVHRSVLLKVHEAGRLFSAVHRSMLLKVHEAGRLFAAVHRSVLL